jgi:hypothetical protein
MCRGRSYCTALGNRESWSTEAPLPVPDWIRRQLDRVHDCIRLAAQGNVEESKRLLALIPSDEIREWGVEHGQLSGRFRNNVLRLPAPEAEPATGTRTASPALRARVLARDRYHCRYCGVRVIPREVLVAYGSIVGQEVFGTERANAARHGAALVSWAEVDHVVPYQQGGPTTEDNLVTSCWACNYGKDRYTVHQLGISDPRERAPVDSDWDGLWPLLPRLQDLAPDSGAQRADPQATARRSSQRSTRPKPKRGNGKPRLPAVYEAIRRALPAFPRLQISNPNPTAWVYFGKLGKSGARATIRYRLPDRWAELVLYRSTTSEEELRRCHRENPIPGAAIAPRGRTELAVWKPTPELDLEADVDQQSEEILGALQVVDELRRWYAQHAERLCGISQRQADVTTRAPARSP